LRNWAHNHGGSVPTAIQLIKAAAACGASAVKLQKRQNATLYSRALLNAPYEHEHSFGKTYGEHRHALEFDLQPYISCRAVAQAYKLDFFATAFDEPSADFLMQVDVPAIKIHSGGLTDQPLLHHVATLGVPLILSTGGGDDADIDRAVQILAAHTTRFALLHCTASYPLNPKKRICGAF
jgi:sialic acid synthase